MTVLIATIGEGKGTWGHVAKVIEEPWEQVYLIMTDYFKDKFTAGKKTSVIIVDENKSISDISLHISKALEGKFFGDCAVNIVSGSGKLHMALLAALLKIGAGIRFVALTQEGVKEL